MQTPTNTDIPQQSAQPPTKKPTWYRRTVRLSGQLFLLSLAIGGLTLLWLLVRPNSQQPPTSTAQVATATSSPTANMTSMAVAQSTASTFITVAGYQFQFPQLVTETSRIIQVAQWIDNSDHELLIRSADEEKFTVEIFDLRQGSLERLADTTTSLVGMPIWLPELQQAAYLSQNKTGTHINLFLSQTNSRISASRLLREEVAPPIVPDTNGTDILVLDRLRERLQTTNSTKRVLNSFILTEDLPISSFGLFSDYQATWTDQHNWIAYYNQEQFLLINSKTQEIKKISLGEVMRNGSQVELQASCGRWSPDGQKLALIVGAWYNQSSTFTELAIFDLATSETQLIETNFYHITDITWSPNSKQVLITAKVGQLDGYSVIEMFLVETKTKAVISVPVLPTPAGQTSFCNGLTWSITNDFILSSYDDKFGDSKRGWYLVGVTKS